MPFKPQDGILKHGINSYKTWILDCAPPAVINGESLPFSVSVSSVENGEGLYFVLRQSVRMGEANGKRKCVNVVQE